MLGQKSSFQLQFNPISTAICINAPQGSWHHKFLIKLWHNCDKCLSNSTNQQFYMAVHLLKWTKRYFQTLAQRSSPISVAAWSKLNWHKTTQILQYFLNPSAKSPKKNPEKWQQIIEKSSGLCSKLERMQHFIFGSKVSWGRSGAPVWKLREEMRRQSWYFVDLQWNQHI